MYYKNSQKNYYRFPNKSSVTDFDVNMPFYFPTKNKFGETDFDDTPVNGSHSFFTEPMEDIHNEHNSMN